MLQTYGLSALQIHDYGHATYASGILFKDDRSVESFRDSVRTGSWFMSMRDHAPAANLLRERSYRIVRVANKQDGVGCVANKWACM